MADGLDDDGLAGKASKSSLITHFQPGPGQPIGRFIACSLLGALTLAACGGNSHDDPDSQAAVEVQCYGANPVSVWNEIAFTAGGTTPAVNADLATVHLVMDDAVIAIAGTHQPCAIRPSRLTSGLGAVAMQAAAIESAYRALLRLAPASGAGYEAARSSGLKVLADGDAKTRGTAIGAEVAASMLALRANDGRNAVLSPHVPGAGPGQFRSVNPVLRVLPSVRPFATQGHAQFRAPGPPALGSVAYATDFNETKTMAAANSMQRTAVQTEVARFHTEAPGDPVLILADEPTAALDTQRGTKVMAMVRQIARERRSAEIAVTHDHRMIEGFDTVYHLEDGRLARVDHHAQVADATPA